MIYNDKNIYFKLNEIQILNNSLLKIRDSRVVISSITTYSSALLYVPNDITYCILDINNSRLYFSEESKIRIDALLINLDSIIKEFS